MPIKNISPREAKELLDSGEGYIYLDVRSVPEFISGHPQGAVNIPLLDIDPVLRQMVPNPDFLAVVEANFPKDTKLIVGCQSGMRSARAVEILQQAGYTHIVHMQAGFGGMRDPFGRVSQPGWSQLQLPISTDNGEGVSYESLAAKAQEKNKKTK
ncbi:MAG TPA: rhodanese-like domain-containing protein [Candidatus Limnocylindrales bacterium]|nr:rhodanese-like domain-containing protein [Candidatus Limnocylindrales bacterium]